jgi:acetylglutamate kinase
VTKPQASVSTSTEQPPGARPVVVKIGGRALDRPGAAAELGSALAALERGAVVVHGGGAEVSVWSERLGLEPRFVDGFRVTDRATLEVVVAVLAGLANKRLVAALRAADVDAVGLAALDGGLVEVAPHPDSARLGEVGAVNRVNPALIETLISQGRVPVLASVAARHGQLLNLNADDLAAAIAGALRSPALVLLSDAPGVVLGGAVAPRLTGADALVALAGSEVKEGMRVKLAAARIALEAGVSVVHVSSWRGPGTLASLLAGHGHGTSLVGPETAHV